MTLKEQVFAHALLLAGDLDGHETELLNALCAASTATLAARLKTGLTPEDCKADFIAAASLYALSALESVADVDQAEEFRAGDLTVKRGGGSGGSAASNCLRNQAELVITPYLEDRFAFLGV